MSFLATQSPPAAVEEPTVSNDGWFPGVDPTAVRAQARLDGTVTKERLHQALVSAMVDVNRELLVYKLQWLAEGVNSLAQVPGPDTAGERVWLIHYRNAVIAHIQASMAERYRDFDTTGDGDKKADELQSSADTHRRNLRWAISGILGIPRTTVELI